MTTKVTVGLCKTVDLSDIGTLQASCRVELNLDACVLDDDPDSFRQYVRRAYVACRESVEGELAQHQSAGSRVPNACQKDGQDSRQDSGGRNGQVRGATQNQIRAIQGIAARNRVDLGPLLSRFGVRSAEDLSVGQASSLIDELKGKASENGSSR